MIKLLEILTLMNDICKIVELKLVMLHMKHPNRIKLWEGGITHS